MIVLIPVTKTMVRWAYWAQMGQLDKDTAQALPGVPDFGVLGRRFIEEGPVAFRSELAGEFELVGMLNTLSDAGDAQARGPATAIAPVGRGKQDPSHLYYYVVLHDSAAVEAVAPSPEDVRAIAGYFAHIPKLFDTKSYRWRMPFMALCPEPVMEETDRAPRSGKKPKSVAEIVGAEISPVRFNPRPSSRATSRRARRNSESVEPVADLVLPNFVELLTRRWTTQLAQQSSFPPVPEVSAVVVQRNDFFGADFSVRALASERMRVRFNAAEKLLQKARSLIRSKALPADFMQTAEVRQVAPSKFDDVPLFAATPGSKTPQFSIALQPIPASFERLEALASIVDPAYGVWLARGDELLRLSVSGEDNTYTVPRKEIRAWERGDQVQPLGIPMSAIEGYADIIYGWQEDGSYGPRAREGLPGDGVRWALTGAELAQVKPSYITFESFWRDSVDALVVAPAPAPSASKKDRKGSNKATRGTAPDVLGAINIVGAVIVHRARALATAGAHRESPLAKALANGFVLDAHRVVVLFEPGYRAKKLMTDIDALDRGEGNLDLYPSTLSRTQVREVMRLLVGVDTTARGGQVRFEVFGNFQNVWDPELVAPLAASQDKAYPEFVERLVGGGRGKGVADMEAQQAAARSAGSPGGRARAGGRKAQGGAFTVDKAASLPSGLIPATVRLLRELSEDSSLQAHVAKTSAAAGDLLSYTAHGRQIALPEKIVYAMARHGIELPRDDDPVALQRALLALRDKLAGRIDYETTQGVLAAQVQDEDEDIASFRRASLARFNGRDRAPSRSGRAPRMGHAPRSRARRARRNTGSRRNPLDERALQEVSNYLDSNPDDRQKLTSELQKQFSALTQKERVDQWDYRAAARVFPESGPADQFTQRAAIARLTQANVVSRVQTPHAEAEVDLELARAQEFNAPPFGTYVTQTAQMGLNEFAALAREQDRSRRSPAAMQVSTAALKPYKVRKLPNYALPEAMAQAVGGNSAIILLSPVGSPLRIMTFRRGVHMDMDVVPRGDRGTVGLLLGLVVQSAMLWVGQKDKRVTAMNVYLGRVGSTSLNLVYSAGATPTLENVRAAMLRKPLSLSGYEAERDAAAYKKADEAIRARSRYEAPTHAASKLPEVPAGSFSLFDSFALPGSTPAGRAAADELAEDPARYPAPPTLDALQQAEQIGAEIGAAATEALSAPSPYVRKTPTRMARTPRPPVESSPDVALVEGVEIERLPAAPQPTEAELDRREALETRAAAKRRREQRKPSKAEQFLAQFDDSAPGDSE